MKSPLLLALVLSFFLASCKDSPVEDNSLPVVKIIYPTDSSSIVYSPVAINVHLRSEDNIAHVELYADTVLLVSDSAAPYEYLWNVYFWADDSFHTLRAVATSKFGLKGYDTIAVRIAKSAATGVIPVFPPFADIRRDTNAIPLIWRKLERAMKYEIQLSLGSEFTSTEFDATTTDTVIVTPPLTMQLQTYYWRIRAALADSAYGPWNQSSIFSLDGPLPPEPLNPQHATQRQTVHLPFRWTASVYARSYQILVQDDLHSIVVDETFAPESLTVDNLSLGKYLWKVRARNGAGFWGAWSDSISFGLGVFQRQLTYSDEEWMVDFDEMPDSGFVVLSYGLSLAGNTRHTIVTRTDALGLTLWKLDVPGLFSADAVALGAAGSGIFFAGHELTDSSIYILHVVKLGLNGTILWNKEFSALKNIYIRDMETATDGNLILCGGQDTSVYLLKMSTDGDILFQKRIQGARGHLGTIVAPINDGGFGIFGYGVDPQSVAPFSMIQLRTDAAGDTMWEHVTGGNDWLDVRGGIVNENKEFISAGTWTSAYGVFIMKSSPSGDEVWRTYLNRAQPSMGYDLVPGHDGGYVLTGYLNGQSYLAKVGEGGGFEWSKTYNRSNGYKIVATRDGGYCILGQNLQMPALMKVNSRGITFP